MPAPRHPSSESQPPTAPDAPADESRTRAEEAAGQTNAYQPLSEHTLAHDESRASAENWPRVPGYEILDVLGHGGMGVVYKARQKGLKRLVALKMILAGAHAGAGEVARFCTEAESAARLQHPHIVQVHEIGEWRSEAGTAPLPFLSLEFVDGGSLSAYLHGTPQPPRLAAQLVRTLAEAMQYAHDHHVIHRDLKPANVLLASADGGGPPVPKIADFGLAKKLDDQSGQTLSGTVVGTPSYMAPEQAAGKTTVGPAADVYALGAILYETLTGRPPFKGASVLDTLQQVRHHEPVPPRRLQPGVPRDLETIGLKCLQKDPAKRYGRAADLADDLGRFLNGEPIRARPVGPLERGWRWCRRNPLPAALATGFVLALLAGTGFSIRYAVRASERETAATASELVARQRKDESDRRRYVAEFRWAMQKWQDGQIDETLKTLDGLAPTGDDPDLRGFEWHYLRRLCGLELRSLIGHGDAVFAAACSPNGRWIATAGSDKTVRVWDRATGQAVHVLRGHTDEVFCVAFSADGGTLASGGVDATVRIWDPVAGTETATLRGHTATVRGLSFHPDGRRLASCGTDKTIRVWDLPTRQARVLTGHTALVQAVAFGHNGQSLWSAGHDATVRVWNPATGEPLRTLTGHTGKVMSLAVSPDGRLAAAAGDDRTIKLWDTKSGLQTAALPGHAAAVRGLAFSPDGARLTSCGEDRIVRVWDVAAAREVLTFRGHAGPVYGVAVSPDGRHVVSAGSHGVTKVWDATAAAEQRAIRGHTALVTGVCFSPDGRRFASASWDGTVRIWDALSGLEEKTLRGHHGNVYSVSYSARSPLLASTGEDRTVRLWNAESGRELARLGDADTVSTCCAFSPAADVLAIGGRDHAITLWDVTRRVPLRTLTGHTGPVRAVAFRGDGRRLVTVADDRTTRVWDAETGETLWVLPDDVDGASAAAIRPDGRVLVEGIGLRVWDMETQTRRFALRQAPPRGVVFSPDGKRIASVGLDHRVRVWDAGTGLELLSLSGMARAGRSVAFSPDGLTLAAATEDERFHVWDAEPLDPARNELREAAGLVRVLFDRSASRAAVLDGIRTDLSVSEAVRRRARELAERLPAKPAAPPPP